MKNESLKRDILNGLMIVVGTIIMGIGFNLFLTPNNISSGGFSGLAAVIAFFLNKIQININPSIIYLILNIGLYIFAYKLVGKKFAIFALIGIVSFSVSMEVTSLFNFYVKDDLLVCSLYGGTLFGLGSGIVLKNNGSTGGCDMLATIVRSITIKLKTGQIIFICDSIVLLLSVLAYGANSLLYSLITVCLASEITDLVIDGSRGIKAYYIITNKKEEVSNKIFETIKRGATEIKSTGMYTHQDKSMILCLINKYRAPMLKKLVLEIDPEAFVFSTNISEVLGNGFYVPQQKKNEKKKKLSKINSQNSNKPIELQNEKVEDNSIDDATKNVEIENVENDCKNNENANTNNNIVSTPEDNLNNNKTKKTQKNKPKDI